MKITILTLFPEMFSGFLNQSIVKRAIAKGLVGVEAVNIRDFTEDRYGRVDTPPIGGGAGLVMKVQPIDSALKAVKNPGSHTILLSPRGVTFDQKHALRLKDFDHVILVCGHYEGIDERVAGLVDEEVSLGDFILTGGEVGAMAIADAVIRLLPGTIEGTSLDLESFDDGLLEYPQYTEPFEINGQTVPVILYSGHHEAVMNWRHLMRLVVTRQKRPDLFARYPLTSADARLLRDYDNGVTPNWLSSAIEKGAKFTKGK
ncbi:MAG: tRNA (guanosine(37)-N1)-methyltransferase TrmD [Bacilli bacterium]|jgi:tRNA (guanine37-N1)-methyltransferase